MNWIFLQQLGIIWLFCVLVSGFAIWYQEREEMNWIAYAATCVLVGFAIAAVWFIILLF